MSKSTQYDAQQFDEVFDAPTGVAPGKRTLTASLAAPLAYAVQRKALPAAHGGAPAAAPAASATPVVGDDPFGLHLLGRPVQRAPVAASGASEDQVHAAAAHGIAGASEALPHAETIQRAFGKHDVSGIRSHTGAAAATATDAMGAKAYASGSDVAFAPGATDLHTAAHEAAHVVQQRAGVHLKGGVGEEGDAYERQADQVADAVVAGQSAEGILDGIAPGGGASTTGVQHRGAGALNKIIKAYPQPADLSDEGGNKAGAAPAAANAPGANAPGANAPAASSGGGDGGAQANGPAPAVLTPETVDEIMPRVKEEQTAGIHAWLDKHGDGSDGNPIPLDAFIQNAVANVGGAKDDKNAGAPKTGGGTEGAAPQAQGAAGEGKGKISIRERLQRGTRAAAAKVRAIGESMRRTGGALLNRGGSAQAAPGINALPASAQAAENVNAAPAPAQAAQNVNAAPVPAQAAENVNAAPAPAQAAQNVNAAPAPAQADPSQVAAKVPSPEELELVAAASKLAAGMIAAAATAEPRITTVLQQIADSCKGEMLGLEHKFKSVSSLARKMADTVTTSFKGQDPILALDPVSRDMKDVLRYTMAIPANEYKKVFDGIEGVMAAANFKQVNSKNSWAKEGGTYKGINQNYKTAGDLVFELQLHTAASFEGKMDNHHAYEEARLPATSPERLKVLNAEMSARMALVPVPAGMEPKPKDPT